MKYKENKIKNIYFLVLGVSLSITSSLCFAQKELDYGTEGRVLKDGEVPSPNAICQSYGYGNVMQTKCFDAEPNNGKRDTPNTAKNIDLKDTVESATTGEHRTVFTYRDRNGILHYTENVPAEYKNNAQVFKRGTIKDSNPTKMIAYPKEYAGPAIPAEHPSIGKDYSNSVIPADQGISSTGTRISSSIKSKSNKSNKKSNNKSKSSSVKSSNKDNNKISKNSSKSKKQNINSNNRVKNKPKEKKPVPVKSTAKKINNKSKNKSKK